MATIVMQAGGAALGGIVAGPLGTIAGRALGGLAGRAVDERLFNRRRSVENARLVGGRIFDADEGAGVARLYGTGRIAGQLIWATRFEEEQTSERQGGKGGGGGGETVSYRYFGNFAIGLCEGPIAHLRRVWADGEEMDLSGVDYRVHKGTEDQAADPLIEMKQGAGNAPAYRGLAYIVFERLPLERWGNRIPQIACEVIRSIGELERATRAITIIPGANEHGLDPVTVREGVGAGQDKLVNRNIRHGDNDFRAAVDELTALCPNLERAALVVAWFADDLRVGQATLRPGVEVHSRDESEPWSVQGLARDEAHLISRIGEGPAYGGTPSDAGVVRALQDLTSRGLKVTYYPFILMDVPPDNTLPDPYEAERQAPYPWRGRMTLDIEAGRPGSLDQTDVAREEIETFVGEARADDFSIEEGAVRYDGPEEWSYRRMILHHAFLAEAAGGVDAFVIGSEMRGLTRLRDAQGRFPFVEALIGIAAEVKAILPQASLTYAADWSEYFGYQPPDGSGDVFYNLDPLWAHPAIDVVGIDNYLPLAEWRVEDWQTGGPDEVRSPYDRKALALGVVSGEHHQWYYASEADRRARIRTPITDGGGKPWVYRAKDIAAWWSNPHIERRGGVEIGEPTAWVPFSKPVWLTELGCPAIDKGANQPNVFVDPKSAESAFPHHSSGARDDHQQRRFLEAELRHWGRAEANPISPVYGGAMIEEGAIHLWTWDTRPYPAFPLRSDVWSDGPNWERGHWLTGRLGKAPLDELIAAILNDHGFTDFDVSTVDGEVGGYLVTGPGSARGELEDLLRLGNIGVRSSGGRLVFFSQRDWRRPTWAGALVDDEDRPLIEIRRREASEIPQEFVVGFNDAARDYEGGSVGAAMAAASPARIERLDLPVTLDETEARRFAEGLLAESLGGRETASFAVSPTELHWEPGDRIELGAASGIWRITRIEDGVSRRIEAGRLPSPVRESADDRSERPVPGGGPALASRPKVEFLDLPDLAGRGDARIAVFARPWIPYELLAAPGETGFKARGVLQRPATMGELAEALAPGPEAVIDRGNDILVDLYSGELTSISATALLAGANLAAVRSSSGAWEVIQFEAAEEVGAMRFRLTNLVRALGGTDDAMRAGAPAGSSFVLLDSACVPVPLEPSEVGLALNWRVVPAGRALDDPATHVATAVLGLRAEQPLSPVHLRADFASDGGFALRWTRRGRIGADRWDGLEIPLGEEIERYAIRVTGEGATIERETGDPALVLSAAEQLSAFGSLPANLDVEICQLSLTAGRGTPRRHAFNRP